MFISLKNPLTASALVAAVVPVLLLVSPSRAQKLTILYSFHDYSDGAYPISSLVRDPAGNFYGTTDEGGYTGGGCYWRGCGTIFKVDSAGHKATLHSFGRYGGDAVFPYDGLIRDAAGNLYGTAQAGGTWDEGAVFKLDSAGKETLIHSFSGKDGGEGQMPKGSLVGDPAGNLYGVTAQGGGAGCFRGCGTVYKIDAGGTATVLHSFQGAPDGAYPQGSLVRDRAGNLYGTTLYGGNGPCGYYIPGCGTVYRLAPDGTVTILHSFAGPPDGTSPVGGLVRDSAGNLYGITETGGLDSCNNYSCGTVFKIDAAGNETILHDFAVEVLDGAGPSGGLVIDSQGNLYGTTHYGGSWDYGTVFKVDTEGNETRLYNFIGHDGYVPYGRLIIDRSGRLYGTTELGGSHNYGEVFMLEP